MLNNNKKKHIAKKKKEEEENKYGEYFISFDCSTRQ